MSATTRIAPGRYYSASGDYLIVRVNPADYGDEGRVVWHLIETDTDEYVQSYATKAAAVEAIARMEQT